MITGRDNSPYYCEDADMLSSRKNLALASSVHGVEREEYEIGSGIKQAWVAWTSGVCRVEGRRSKCGSGSSGCGVKRGEPIERASGWGFE